jgi:hypothetical protein
MNRKKSLALIEEIKEVNDVDSNDPNPMNSNKLLSKKDTLLSRRRSRLSTMNFQFNRQITKGSLRAGSQFDLLTVQNSKKALFMNTNKKEFNKKKEQLITHASIKRIDTVSSLI